MKIGRFETNNIYCEDSFKAIKDIPDNSVDCIYVDIPYLYMGGGGGTSRIALQVSKMKQELKENNIYDGIDYKIFEDFVRIMKKINCFIWCSKEQVYPILDWWMKNTNCTYQIMCWCKTNPVPMCNGNWLSDIEYCLYFNRGTKFNDGYELKSKWYASPINQKDKDKYEHPTIKPLALVKRHILHTTQPNDIVADFFMGSGTTCVACKDTERQYLGFEIEPKWFSIAQDRLNCLAANGQISLFLT